MSESETKSQPLASDRRKGFWDFCCEHPVVVVFSVFCIAWGAAQVATSITGNYPPDDGFWKYNGHMASCN